ncbi:hypothetical protein Tco_1014524 [Tanacetum coccineum]
MNVGDLQMELKLQSVQALRKLVFCSHDKNRMWKILFAIVLEISNSPQRVLETGITILKDDDLKKLISLIQEYKVRVEYEKIPLDKFREMKALQSPRIHTDLVSSDTKKLQELTVTDTTPTPSSSLLNTKLSTTNRLLSLFKAIPARFKRYKSFFQELQGRYGYLFEHLRAKFLSRKSFDTLADHLQEVMVESLPTMVDNHIKEQVEK